MAVVEVWNVETGDSEIIQGVDARERVATGGWVTEKPVEKPAPVKRKRAPRKATKK